VGKGSGGRACTSPASATRCGWSGGKVDMRRGVGEDGASDVGAVCSVQYVIAD